jgi:hypothetical protein
VSKFKVGDRVRYLDEPMVGIVEQVLPGVGGNQYLVKWPGNRFWYDADDLVFVSHAPASLDDVSNEEWNQNRETKRIFMETFDKAIDGIFESDVDSVLSEIRSILLAKNKAYGNSALKPVRIFSKADPAEQLKVRIDDKLSRLIKGNEFADEDTVTDLLGYLVLYKIASKK